MIPVSDDSSRVFLDPKMTDNYINAVFVQGYKRQDAFIATEAPLPDRRYMFWQMVVQKLARVIVVMNDLEEEDVSYKLHYTQQRCLRNVLLGMMFPCGRFSDLLAN